MGRAPPAAPTCRRCATSRSSSEPGHHLPRRPAAGEGGDRRSGDAEDLGGADVHTRISGVVRPSRRNDQHALAPPAASSRTSTGRRIRRSRCSNRPNRSTTRRKSCTASSRPTPKPFDVRGIIARIVDGSEFDEFKSRYGTTLVCGFARIWGYRSASSPTTASSSRNRR